MATLDWDNRRVVLDAEAFRQALEAMGRIVGDAHVSTDASELDRVAKATIPDPKRVAAIVRPGTAEEVAEVVRIANRFEIPIWPSSAGRNWGYGSATPVLEGTVLLKLDRLNRVLEVNEELAYAVNEPGVSYRQLRGHLDAHHPTLWSDSTDGPPDGSVIGNALDRGLGVTHYADHFGTLCGLEVVLPTGEIVRTGGGPEGCHTWHTHKWGVGPYLEGLFSQSGLGVVTKAGVWLMPRPEAFTSFTLDLEDDANLPRLVDAVRDLGLRNILQTASHIVNDIVTLSVLSQYPAHLLAKHSRLPPDALAGLRARYRVPAWSVAGSIQGTSAFMRGVKREVRARLGGMGRLLFMGDATACFAGVASRLARRPALRGPITWAVGTVVGKSLEMLEAAPHIHSVLQGIPSDYFVRHAYFKSAAPKPERADPDRDDCGLVWFAPIAPMTGAHVANVLAICRPLFEKHEFDFYAALLVQNARSMIVLTSIFFLKQDAGQTERAKRLYDELAEATTRSGYQQYRIGVGGMHKLAHTAPDFVALVRSLKRAVDPRNVVAQGKYSA